MPATPPSLTTEQIHAISRALADPRRFAIFEQIARCGDLICGQLDVHDSLTPATVSHHLRDLQNAGLIGSRRDGRVMQLWVERATWQAYLDRLRAL